MLEGLRDNQQPELAGTLSNGSETDRVSRTETAAMPKIRLENICWMGYNISIPQEIFWHNTANILFLVPKPHYGVQKMTEEEFLDLRAQGLSFSEIGACFNLTERQVNYRTKKWGLDYSKKKDLNESFFSSNTKAVYYWAGFLAADGYIEKERNRVGLGLQAQDIQHIEKFKLAVGSTHAVCPFMNNSAYRIRFNSATMIKDLEEQFNITAAKTFTYKMPDFEDEYLLLEFFRGYIEGDGHIEKTASGNLRLHLCSANETFLLDFIELCSILINKPIYQSPSLQVNKKGQVYAIVFTISDSMELLRLIYKNSTTNTRLDRKYEVVSSVIR